MQTLRKILAAGLLHRGSVVESMKGAATLALSLTQVHGLARLFGNPVFDRHVAQSSESDPLFAVRHRHYLARGLSMAERVRCAVSHFEFEHAHCGADYHAAVHSPDGLALWQARFGDTRYAIVLRDSGNLRHEGPLSIVMKADERVLHVTSFAWVPVRIVDPRSDDGASTATTMFVARNQSQHASAASMVRFRTDFPQNAPAYFCLAATLAVAQAHGHGHVTAVHHERQVAYERQLAAGFRRSYGEFWGSFGGECASDGVYRMPAPVHMPPLDRVPNKHRARARARRAHWTEISQTTLDTLRPHLGSAARTIPHRAPPALSGPSALLGSPLAAWLPEWLGQVPLPML
jgi:uncharacterized protein